MRVREDEVHVTGMLGPSAIRSDDLPFDPGQQRSRALQNHSSNRFDLR